MDYYHFFYPSNLVQRQTRRGFVPRLICRLLNEVLCDVAELTGDFRADLSTKSQCRNRFTRALRLRFPVFLCSMPVAYS